MVSSTVVATRACEDGVDVSDGACAASFLAGTCIQKKIAKKKKFVPFFHHLI